MSDDEKAYTFAPTYRDESTGYHRPMISVVVFFYSNTLKIMLVYYSAIDMGCFDKYLGAAPRAKTMRGNGSTTFILHVSQCITLHQNICYSKIYCRGIDEVILFNVRFQAY